MLYFHLLIKMKKTIIFLISLIIMLSLLTTYAFAEEDIYSEEYFSENLFSNIDKETLSVLEEFGISDLSCTEIYSVSITDIARYFSESLSERVKLCVKFFTQLLMFVFINAIIKSYFGFNSKDNTVNIISIISVTLIIISKLNTLINMLLSSISSCGTFMLGFIPVYTVLISLCGSPAAAIAYNSLTFAFAQGISGFINKVLIKLTGSYFCLSLSLCINENMNVGRLINIVNKTVNFIIGFLACGFTGLLSVKGITSSAVDAVSAKSVKFLLSSLIPIVGSSISDAYSSLIGSIGLIKSSVAIVGILVVLIISLPALIESSAYCFSLSLISYLCEVFELDGVSSAVRVFYSGLKFIVMLNVFEVFILIISTGIMLTVKGV